MFHQMVAPRPDYIRRQGQLTNPNLPSPFAQSHCNGGERERGVCVTP